MDKVIYASFAAERDEKFRLSTQIIERNGKRHVRKNALSNIGNAHIAQLAENEKTMLVRYQHCDMFRINAVTAMGDGWTEFEYLSGKTLEKWIDERLQAGDKASVMETLHCFWKNLCQLDEGPFQISKEYSRVFGSELPEGIMLHGAADQDIDLVFTNLFLGKEDPACLTITDYEWVFPFSIPLEYVFFRSVFCSVAISRLSKTEKLDFYAIAGIWEKDLSIFLKMETAFQQYVSGQTKTMAEHYRRMGRDILPLSLRQPYEIIIRNSTEVIETKTSRKTETVLDLTEYLDDRLSVQLGYPFNVITIQPECINDWQCDNADYQENNIYIAGTEPLIFIRKDHTNSTLSFRICDIDEYSFQNTVKTQILNFGNKISELETQVRAYQEEWSQLFSTGEILHNEPVSLIQNKQGARLKEQQKQGTGPDATIVIPTKNGGELFRQVLDHVFGQVTQYTFEVICVDSGSTDNTLQIIRNSQAKLFEIAPEDFGHGKTRNYGAEKGSGEFICFLTQDALPVHESWLENMLNAMKMDEKIAGGFGRHLPYSQCNFIDERDINGLFEGFGETNTIYWNEDPERYEKDPGYRSVLSFFSDNNSCIRRSVWEQYPYPDVEFAEDQIWMRQMIEKGYKKVYCPEATVYHSHNYKPSTYFMRYYDEHKGLYEIHGYTNLNHWWLVPAATGKHVLSDLIYIRSMPCSKKSKFTKLWYSIRRNYARYAAGYIGGHYHEKPPKKQAKLDRRYSQQYRQRRGING